MHLRPARVVAPPAVPRLARARMHVLVLNGNGRAGAANTEAVRLQTLGYPAITTGNAPQDVRTLPKDSPGLAAHGSLELTEEEHERRFLEKRMRENG